MSLTKDHHEANNLDEDEETPLLSSREDFPPARTPLPIAQISILLTAWLAECVTAQSILPYVSELVRGLPDVGGDARKVGYYTGMIMSLYHITDALTSFPWNRLSDHIGRKPVLLASLVGTTLSTLLFGLSHSVLALALSRVLGGAFRGHMGAVKTIATDLTDETNNARGFSLLPLAWSFGYVIGPLIGGILSRPQDHWPLVFSHRFWTDYPYFLPCLVAASFTFISSVITALYLEETLTSRPSEKLKRARVTSDIPQGSADDSSDLDDIPPNELDEPLPLSSVLTRPVIVTVANYSMVVLLNTIVLSYIPLVWSTPVEYGGLNMSPASIGLGLSVYGGMDGLVQLLFFPHLVRRFGVRRVFVCSILSCAMIYMLFPFENLAILAAGGGPNGFVWLLIILQLTSYCVFEMAYGTIYMFISSAAPNKRTLGAVYGLAQVGAAVQCAIGRASADWLFAFSLTHNVLGGNFAYVVLVGVVCVELGVSAQLPRNAWHCKD